jgi:hypothetical protein
VDAICINQNDNKEKQHQIAIMADIYGRAETAIMWLGEPERKTPGEVDTALSFKVRDLIKLYYYAHALQYTKDQQSGSLGEQPLSSAGVPDIGPDSPLFRTSWARRWEENLREKARSAGVIEWMDNILFELRPLRYGRRPNEL